MNAQASPPADSSGPHGPSSPAEKKGGHTADDHPELEALQARSGLWLFAVYFLAYAIFMGWAAFAPKTMSVATPLGPNAAIIYGFGLIGGAFVIALLYMLLCKRNADSLRPENRSR